MEQRTVLYAQEGSVFTNGSIFGSVIYLADGADESDFYQIPEEEARRLMGAEEADPEDYRAALAEMGVSL